ncbi:MAG: hypothetical protein GEV06_14545 [Luteitalea sp.]|nr:hypothetical protein [Luteitalea sp.]
MSRVIAAIVLAFLVAFPVQAALLTPAVAWWFKLAWLGLVAIGVLRPSWSPAILVVATPLSPILPVTWPAIPAGLVHLTIMSQALPFLARVVIGRVASPRDPVTASWALVVIVALSTLAGPHLGYLLAGGSLDAWWLEVQLKAARYVFEPTPSLSFGGVVSCTVLLDGLLVAAMVVKLTTAEARRPLLAAAAVTAAVVAGVGIVQSQTLVGLSPLWRFFDPGIVRVNATYTDPNALAAYFALLASVIAGLAGGTTGWRRMLWLVIFTTVVLALVMTAGRMGLLAAIAGLALLVVGALRRDLDRVDAFAGVRRYTRRAATAAAVALGLLLGTAVVVGTTLDIRHDEQTSYVRTWLYTFNLRQPADNIAKGRLAIWGIVGRMIADHPVYGVGPGQLFEQFPRYLTPADRFSPGTTLSAHNTFLSITAELGPAGLAAWLVLLFAVYRSAFDPALLVARTSATWPSLGLATGLAAYGLTMVTGDRTVLREDVVMFAAMGALAAAGRVQSGTGWATHGWRRSLRRVMRLVVLAVLLMTTARAALASRRIDVMDVAFGLYGLERDPHGVPFRWTSGAAMVPVRADARRVTIRIRKLAPIAQRIRARFDGRLLHDSVVTADGWRSLHYVVPPSDLGRPHYFRIEVTPTWPLELQARPLGVMLGDVEVQSSRLSPRTSDYDRRSGQCAGNVESAQKRRQHRDNGESGNQRRPRGPRNLEPAELADARHDGNGGQQAGRR